MTEAEMSQEIAAMLLREKLTLAQASRRAS
jgi:hypothetical protein